jgi:hypothetical protein
MKRQLMAEEWDKFARQVLPPNCAPTQKQAIQQFREGVY